MAKWTSSLKELNLNDCLIKDTGSKAILETLSTSGFNNLQILKLQFNEIKQDTLETIIIPILKEEKLPALNLLELNGNFFEEDCDAIEELREIFSGELDELDDFEEEDSDEESEEEEEEDNEEESLDFNDLIDGLAKLSV